MKKTNNKKTKNEIVIEEKYEENEILDIYVSEINHYSLLTEQQEKDLAQRIQEGDVSAKESLIKANLRFVVKIAKEYENKGLPIHDLIDEGNIGLMKAVEKFDHTKGYHFISYAVWWIRQYMLKAIAEQVGLIRLPLNRHLQLAKIKNLEKDDPDLQNDSQKLATILNTKKEAVDNIIKASKTYISLDTTVKKDAKDIKLENIILDERNLKPEDFAIESFLKNEINSVLDTLNDKEKLVIKYRFGLDNYEELSLSEIGKKFSLTKERIRQIEKKAIRRLRHPKRSRRLKKYLVA